MSIKGRFRHCRYNDWFSEKLAGTGPTTPFWVYLNKHRVLIPPVLSNSPKFDHRPAVQDSGSPCNLAVLCFLSLCSSLVMSSTTVSRNQSTQSSSKQLLQPPGNPERPAGPILSETPVHGGKDTAHHIRKEQAFGGTLDRGSDVLALSLFRSLVASPATPDTPTPIPPPGPGHNSESSLSVGFR